MEIKTKNLTFTLNDTASAPAYLICGKNVTAENADFWRLILDDGMKTEIPVFSHEQSGRVLPLDNGMKVVYDKLVSHYGSEYDIAFTVKIEKEGELIRFTPEIENKSEGVRVNECFCPMTDVNCFVGEKQDDILYMPAGLGERARDPWKKMQALNEQYYYHNEYENVWHVHYPQGSMSWCGVQSGDKFFYTAHYDDQIRSCFISARQKINSRPSDLMLSLDNFPMARPGERFTLASGVIAVLDGDWRAGAEQYRKYAFDNFYKVPEKQDWVRNLSGWQRIIMRSQYGEDYITAEDLPEVYKSGAKYGIHTLFLFGWWKEGMDRAYPYYREPHEGAFKALKENIEKVRQLGGRVILECNCHFMDPSEQFYKEHGEEVRLLDINGNEVRPAFAYPGYGEFRVKYGNKQFPVACSCTETWRQQVLSQIKLMDELGADCLFADCYGAAPTQPCFNDRHEHGARVDADWSGKRKFFAEAEKYCDQHGKVLATEIVTDIASSYSQFVHGWFDQGFNPKSDYFPEMFRYTFPEVVTTNRGVRCPEGDFVNKLRYSCIMGARFDAELYVCRRPIAENAKYAEVIKECTDVFEKYKEFIIDGSFTVSDTSELPAYVKRAEYYNADKSKMLTILLNASSEDVVLNGENLAPGAMSFNIIEA